MFAPIWGRPVCIHCWLCASSGLTEPTEQPAASQVEASSPFNSGMSQERLAPSILQWHFHCVCQQRRRWRKLSRGGWLERKKRQWLKTRLTRHGHGFKRARHQARVRWPPSLLVANVLPSNCALCSSSHFKCCPPCSANVISVFFTLF